MIPNVELQETLMIRRPHPAALRLLAAAALLCLAAAPLLAYTIYLKDGSKLVARDKHRIVGDQAIIVLPNGTQTSIAASEIDVARTEQANRVNYGTAVEIEGGRTGEVQAPAPVKERPKLQDLIASRRGLPPEPQPRRAAETTGAAPPSRTSGGHTDLATLPRAQLDRMGLAADLQTAFRGRGVEEVTVYRGTAPDRPLVEITTNSEAAIFRALEASAAVLLEQRQRGVRLGGLELLMMSSARERAGQFTLTPELASELADDRVEASAFFVRHVQF
jgi:hypothetical protein